MIGSVYSIQAIDNIDSIDVVAAAAAAYFSRRFGEIPPEEGVAIREIDLNSAKQQPIEESLTPNSCL